MLCVVSEFTGICFDADHGISLWSHPPDNDLFMPYSGQEQLILKTDSLQLLNTNIEK